MLVPPQVVSRPGDQGSPTGQCEISGAFLPGDGPFILVMGRYYSRAAVVDMARAFGDSIVVSESAQQKVESILKEVSRARGRIDSATKERDDALAEVASLKMQLGTAKRENDKLAAEVAETYSLREVVEEFLGKPGRKLVAA